MSVTIIGTHPAFTWSDGAIHPRPQGHDTPDARARAEAIAAAVAPRIVGIIFDPAGISQIAAIVAECTAGYDAAHLFRAGDHVLHLPTGEVWVLACDQAMGSVWAAGWPETCAKASDCEIVKRAGNEERRAVLASWSGSDRGARAALAALQLEATP